MISMKENQNQCQFPPFTISTNSSSLSCAIRLDPQDQGATHQQQEITNDLLAVGGTRTSSQPVLEHGSNGNCNQHIGEGHAQGPAKWMSSKMRLMRKMLGTDQILINKQRRLQSLQEQASSGNSPTDIIRVCSNCKTTKTPLWRSGPQGPKSLCNACGIRQMKARRAMRAAAAAAAAAGLSSGIIPTADCKSQEAERRSDVDRTVPFKKRFKIVTSGSSQNKQLQFDDITISLSKKLAFHQAFPQEENDAAVLLMDLSCGPIHG